MFPWIIGSAIASIFIATVSQQAENERLKKQAEEQRKIREELAKKQRKIREEQAKNEEQLDLIKYELIATQEQNKILMEYNTQLEIKHSKLLEGKQGWEKFWDFSGKTAMVFTMIGGFIQFIRYLT